MSIGIGNRVDWCDCCKQSSPIPNPPPNACPLILDGTDDSLTWADPRATAIAPFTMDYSMNFWFTNKETVAKSFTLLSLGKEISGQFYDTIELKYDHTANKLVIELKGDLTGNTTLASAEFELHSAQNSSISGLTSINDKWIECAGNCNLNGGVSIFFSIPPVNQATNVLNASDINLWWNGQLLTASSTESSFWDVNSSYYINFLTLGDYRGASTAATANAVNGEFFSFVWRDTYYLYNSTTANLVYNYGYPPPTVPLFNWHAYALSGTNPSGTPTSATLATVSPNDDVPGTLNADAVIVCGPVPYYCAPTPPPDSCILQLDGTGDYLGWSNANESDISDLDEGGARFFWIRNKNLVGRDFTLLSYGKVLSGVLKWTTEIKYLASTNTLLYMMKDYSSGTTLESWVEFDLFSPDNSPITGLNSVNDKWTKCSGLTDVHGFVFLETTNWISSPNPMASHKQIVWNGGRLTGTRDSGITYGWNPNQGTNFITLGGFGKSPTTGTANADYSAFLITRLSHSCDQAQCVANSQYLIGYPATSLVTGAGANGIMPEFCALTEDFKIPPAAFLTSNTTLRYNGTPPGFSSVAGTLGDNAAYVCAPVSNTCPAIPPPPPSTFTFRVKSTDDHPLPANCDMWTMNVTLNGVLVCEVVKNPSTVATITNPSFQVVATDVIEATVSALSPTGSCSSQYSNTEVFMQTGYGNSNVIPYTTRLNFSSPAPQQSYSFSPVENVDDTINIYGDPKV